MNTEKHQYLVSKVIPFRAYLLEPMLTIALEGGPIKVIPSLASFSANVAFSLRNPYLK